MLTQPWSQFLSLEQVFFRKQWNIGPEHSVRYLELDFCKCCCNLQTVQNFAHKKKTGQNVAKNVARSEGGGDSKIRASSKISKALSPKISICRLCLPFLEVLCGWYIRLWHDDEGNSGCLVWWWQWWWCCLCSCIVAASSGLSQTGFGLHSRDRGVTHRVNQRSRQIYICTELYSCALHRCTYIYTYTYTYKYTYTHTHT